MNETTVAQAKPAAESHYFTPEQDILMFNEHAYVKRMTACGFNEQQAEAPVVTLPPTCHSTCIIIRYCYTVTLAKAVSKKYHNN